MHSMIRWRALVLGALVSLVPGRVQADHLTFLALGQHFYQAQPFGSALAEEDRFLFIALAVPDPAATLPMLNVSVTRPGGPERALWASEPGEPLAFEESFGALADLEIAYPEGGYEFQVWTAPIVSCRVPIERGSGAFPPPPRIADFTAAQSVEAGSRFTVEWDAWEDGSSADFVQFGVRDDEGNSVFETPFLGDPSALNGLASSIEIPPGTLLAAHEYTGEVIRLRFVTEATGECAEVIAKVGYVTVTEFPLTTAGINQLHTPAMLRSVPVDGAMDIPAGSAVAFHFSEPMAPEAAVTWSANAAGLGWTYQWDATAMILYAIASSPLPPAATIRWTLNPSDFHDLDGYALGFSLQGAFMTATGGAATTDVRDVLLVRGEDYGQRTDIPQPLGYHFALAQAELSAPNTVIRGTLDTPAGEPVALALSDDGDTCEAFAEYAFRSDLERFFPDGDYTLTLETAHDGLRTFSLPQDGSELPAPPRIVNLESAQSIDHTQAFVLNWAPFTEASEEDVVLVEVENDQGDTILENGAGELPLLPGTATSFEIPPLTFYPGRQYEGVVRFLKALKRDTTTYPGVEVFSVAATSTRFLMHTGGEPIRPVLRVLPAPANGFSVQVTGEPGRVYVLEVAPDLVSGVPDMGFSYWYSAVAEGGVFELTEYDLMPWNPRRFYRVREAEP